MIQSLWVSLSTNIGWGFDEELRQTSTSQVSTGVMVLALMLLMVTLLTLLMLLQLSAER